MAERNLAVVEGGKPALNAGDIMEQVIAKGDLKELSPTQRGQYYVQVCKSMGLNPLTKPFDYIILNGKLTLYPTRGTADQLRGIHKITPQILSREQVGDCYIVHVRVSAPDGRSDEDLGIVATSGLKGQDLGNAIMKAVTKAKRRATLSLLGLSMPDETEVETIRGARVIPADEVNANVAAPPVEVVEAEVVDDDDDRERANRRYFALLTHRGFTDEANKLLALSMYPTRDDGPTTSRNQLTADELNTLITTIDEGTTQSYDDEGEEIPVPDPAVEYANKIAAATDQKRLAEIGAQMKSDGMGTDWLRKMYARKYREVPASSDDLAAMPRQQGSAGNDRYTS